MSRRSVGTFRAAVVVILLAATGTAVMAALDAFEWFYRHSRSLEDYAYDEIVVFMSLFSVFGLLAISVRQTRRYSSVLTKSRAAESALRRLKQHLENQVALRAAELEDQLGQCERAERRIRRRETELRRLSSELSTVRDGERRQIASDLHDTFGNSLAIINYQLEMLKGHQCPDRCRQINIEIGEVVAESIRFIRELNSRLSMPLTEHLPLGSAVAWLAEEILGPSRIAVKVRVDGEPVFPAGEQRSALMLVLRELFVNILKHAGAHTVKVVVRGHPGGIEIRVRDDGTGFESPRSDSGSIAADSHHGLRTIRERMLLLRGSVSIDSTPGTGTSVILTVPVVQQEPAVSA